ncbi:hypothetical protein ACQKMV_05305 [Lysinibacillus sp. NPDC094403]|uniref:hypothetical protein n=1 Tax=Lysinibacillus sp. NPDC094403 TaxID=3390581 RepID=UPI003D082087
MLENKVVYVFKIDENGYIIDSDLADPQNLKEDEIADPIPLDIIHKPKWNGTKWINGETEEEKTERESQQLLESLKPTPSEIADAELEIKMITMLREMGVIQ